MVSGSHNPPLSQRTMVQAFIGKYPAFQCHRGTSCSCCRDFFSSTRYEVFCNAAALFSVRGCQLEVILSRNCALQLCLTLPVCLTRALRRCCLPSQLTLKKLISDMASMSSLSPSPLNCLCGFEAHLPASVCGLLRYLLFTCASANLFKVHSLCVDFSESHYLLWHAVVRTLRTELFYCI